jgi:hypothetical protein
MASNMMDEEDSGVSMSNLLTAADIEDKID